MSSVASALVLAAAAAAAASFARRNSWIRALTADTSKTHVLCTIQPRCARSSMSVQPHLADLRPRTATPLCHSAAASSAAWTTAMSQSACSNGMASCRSYSNYLLFGSDESCHTRSTRSRAATAEDHACIATAHEVAFFSPQGHLLPQETGSHRGLQR